jgi:hypothetical protein
MIQGAIEANNINRIEFLISSGKLEILDVFCVAVLKHNLDVMDHIFQTHLSDMVFTIKNDDTDDNNADIYNMIFGAISHGIPLNILEYLIESFSKYISQDNLIDFMLRAVSHAPHLREYLEELINNRYLL